MFIKKLNALFCVNAIILFVFLLGNVPNALAERFANDTRYQICFTPGEDCTQAILSVIQAAKNSIFVQAFSFTAWPLAQGLVTAKKRGVNVKVIFDKRAIRKNTPERRLLTYLLKNHVPVWIDHTVNIAHNKVMVIDGKIVVTGSFNFTYSAQFHNAENVLIIHSKRLAEHYLTNWFNRSTQALLLQQYLIKKSKLDY